MSYIFNKIFSKYRIDYAVSVNASSPSANGSLYSPLIYGNNDYYKSQTGKSPGEWWQVDLRFGYFFMNKYRIMSYDHTPDNAHLKSWKIEGSNDHGKTFSSVHNQSDNDYLNGENSEKVFDLDIAYGPFNALRITAFHTHIDSYIYFLRLKEFDAFGLFVDKKCECSYHNRKRYLKLEVLKLM